jgi:hypothetical protein
LFPFLSLWMFLGSTLSLPPPHPIIIYIIPAKGVMILIFTADIWTKCVALLHIEIGKAIKMPIGYTASGKWKKSSRLNIWIIHI